MKKPRDPSGMSPTDPWTRAISDGREYLTPEDVTAAIEAGAMQWEAAKAVLEAVEKKCAEDASLCAFVALRMDPTWKRWR